MATALGMSQGHTNAGDDSTEQLETVGSGGAYGFAEDHLATTRLPPVPRPPPMSRPASAPPVFPSSPSTPGSSPETGVLRPPPPEVSKGVLSALRPAHHRTSWWRALLQPTVPVGALGISSPRGAVQLRLAASSLVVALIMVPVAVAVGLREPPSEWLISPAVSAAVVMARALVSLGLLAFSFVLLRIAERLFAASQLPERDADSRGG
jgi:hypothetical protein